MVWHPEFVRITRAAFDPFVPSSGTEHVACLLYSIARMVRPRSVVEYGSGYTTLYLLAALAENNSDVIEEAAILRVQAGKGLDECYRSNGKTCCIDPGFYLSAHNPQLYSIERFAGDHEYSTRMLRTVAELDLSHFLTYLPGVHLSQELLPPKAFPIDLAWNDDDRYMDFFDTFWPRLNTRGGLMIFHNTVSVESSWNIINQIKEKRFKEGDLEILTLPEPHKIHQNSCTILRRMEDYRPSFEVRTRKQVRVDMMDFNSRNKPEQDPV